MAILKGFPPSNTISPSVRITEKDQSFYDVGTSFHKAGLVGFCSKGPIGIPTLITSRAQLTEVFGNPHPELSDPYLIYAAQQYLAVANQVWIVRVGRTDPLMYDTATVAGVDVPSAGGQVIATSDTAQTYSFDVDSYFRWKLNGVLASKTLVVLADDNRPDPLTGQAYSCLQLVEDLNLQLTADDGIDFFCTEGNEIAVRTTWSYGPSSSIEFVSVADAIYGGPVYSGGVNRTGLGTGMTRAIVAGTTEGYPATGSMFSSGNWDFGDLDTDFDFNLEIVVSGTDLVSVDNVVQVVDLNGLKGNTYANTGAVVNAINALVADLPGGWAAVGGSAAPAALLNDPDLAAAIAAKNITLVSLHHGRDAKLIVKPDSTGDTLLGLPNITGVGTTPDATSGSLDIAEAGLIYGNSDADLATTFSINADSAGLDGNNTIVRVKNDTRQSTFTLEIYQNGVQQEVWGNLTKDETSHYYVETFIATVSNWIRVVDTANPASPLDGEYTLVGGSDGIPADPDDQDALIIGSLTDMTGLYSLSEPEQIDIDLVAVPGRSSTQVIEAMIDVCQNQRTDCMAIIDPPFGLYLQEVIDWHNGRHPLNDTKLDTDFAALYWPWVKIRDNYNLVYMWAPPSGSVLATYANSDMLAAPWFAPAGTTRGVVPGILDVFDRPTLVERDLLLGYRNAVNPIIQFVDTGYLIWGQKTLQRRPTALDRVNVRRMMFVAEKRIRQACRNLLFEPHDNAIHTQFINIATDILQQIKNGRGLTAFKIQCDWELNTAERVNRNEMWAKIGIQPTKAVEFIFIEFSIHNQGNWSETSASFV